MQVEGVSTWKLVEGDIPKAAAAWCGAIAKVRGCQEAHEDNLHI